MAINIIAKSAIEIIAVSMGNVVTILIAAAKISAIMIIQRQILVSRLFFKRLLRFLDIISNC